jgi:hypothetical protein
MQQAISRQRSMGCILRHAPFKSGSAAVRHRTFQQFHPHKHIQLQPQHRARFSTQTLAGAEIAGLVAFFTPGLAALAYAFVRGKGNMQDGLSHLLTEVSQGYFQPDVGGKTIPVAEGDLSDLAGDEPLFKALYKW